MKGFRGLSSRIARSSQPALAVPFVAGATSIASLLGYFYGLFSMTNGVRWVLLPGVAAAVAFVVVARRAGRSDLADRALGGIFAGGFATLAYDVCRIPLVHAGLPIFKAISYFGTLIVGSEGVTPAAELAGWAYHYSNGIGFALMYAALFTRPRLWTAVVWGTVLEGAMLLTPYAEVFGYTRGQQFVTITLGSHFIYGAGLWAGLLLWEGRWLRPTRRGLATGFLLPALGVGLVGADFHRVHAEKLPPAPPPELGPHLYTTFTTFMTYAYDSDDNRTRETDALSRVTAHTFDALRRLTSTTDAAASPNTTSFAYDAEGSRVQVVDALGRKTVLVHDDLGRMIESQAHGSPSQPLSPALVTAFAYDAAGNVTKVIDPKDQETTYSYSALSELTAVTQHLGQTVAYAYDPRGRLARVTNARGQALVHVYEPFGGLAEVRHYSTAADADAGTNLARTVSYAYDASGNLTETGDTDYSSSAPTLETTVYDELDRPELVTVHYVPGGDRTLESAYDRYGNRKNLVFTDGSDVLSHTWTYDKLNHLAQADLASPSPLAFTYYANDDLETITHGNGVTTEYTYFPEGPVETITVESPSEQLLGLTYAVDKVLNITGITEQHEAAGPNHVYSYGYDALDRLTSATYPTALGLPASESFAYDDAGNREEPADPSAYAYDANNRITASPGKAWVYDGDGNPVSVNAGLSTEETFAHDASNRMRGYSNAATSTAASYLYDPFARRMKKTVNGAATWFIWDGDQLLAEFDGSGARGRRYTYTGGFAPAEQVIAGAIGEDVQPVHTDHLDMPRSLSGAGGESVWRAAHRAFGTTTANEDPDGDLVDVRFSIRFPGQFEDAESGLHYNRFRTYNPAAGRYTSVDPMGQRDSDNTYEYAGSAPTVGSDRYGLTSISPTDSPGDQHRPSLQFSPWMLPPTCGLPAIAACSTSACEERARAFFNNCLQSAAMIFAIPGGTAGAACVTGGRRVGVTVGQCVHLVETVERIMMVPALGLAGACINKYAEDLARCKGRCDQ